MTVSGLFLAATAAATLWTSSALTCYRYGPVYHKSDGGKVNIDPTVVPPACKESDIGNRVPCLDTCAASVKECYNYYRPNGFSGTGEAGGGSANYGKSQGGCFLGPVDSGWTGTTCISNLNTTKAEMNGVPTDDIRQNCCTMDKCNDRPNSTSSQGVVCIQAMLAALVCTLAHMHLH